MCSAKAISTAADVAARAGVDRSTVSRILNRAFTRHRYAPQTIRAVQRAARELNYRPSMTGRALRMGRTMVIGLVVGDIANRFFGQLAAAIESRLREHRYRIMISSTLEDTRIQRQAIDDMLRREVDGLILSPAGASGLKLVRSHGTPMVFVDRPLARCAWPYVGIDNHAAGRQLGEHLRLKGYRRVGVVLPQSEGDPTLRWRLQGLRTGLGDAGRIVWRHHVPLRIDRDARRHLSERVRQTANEVQGIVGLTNDSTVTALEAARDVGLRVPGEIGLAGIDDFRAAELLDPPLTMVAQPIDRIAEKAVEQLLAAMRGESGNADCLLSPYLIPRRSLTTLP